MGHLVSNECHPYTQSSNTLVCTCTCICNAHLAALHNSNVLSIKALPTFLCYIILHFLVSMIFAQVLLLAYPVIGEQERANLMCSTGKISTYVRPPRMRMRHTPLGLVERTSTPNAHVSHAPRSGSTKIHNVQTATLCTG